MIFKHPAGKSTLRIDKIKAHANHVAHARAVRRWKVIRSAPAPAPAPAPSDQQESPADIALANLVRTIVSVAVHKSPIQLIPMLVELQAANQTLISTSHTSSSNGVQTFLHAAAMLLKGEQNERLQQAGMLSDMGDGSTDRKTIEQEIIYARYPQ